MGTILTILGGIGVLSGVGFFAGKWAFKKWILPMIKTREQKDLAIHIGNIADEITDNLVEMFPDAKWDDMLDKGIDELLKIVKDKDIPESNIKPEIARRALGAAIHRKRNQAIELQKKELVAKLRD